MNREDARVLLSILGELDFEYRFTKDKGATISALRALANGHAHAGGINNERLEELLEVFIRANIIHKVRIGKRFFYRLGEYQIDPVAELMKQGKC